MASMKRRMMTGAVLVCVTAVVTSALPPAATASARRGRIAFQRVFWASDGSTDHIAIFIVEPDGSELRQITHPPSGVETGRVDWSPDGRSIAYIRGTAASDPRRFHIFRMRANGRHRRDLSKGHCRPQICEGEEDPTWSPNGRRIAFIRSIAGVRSLFVMRSNGAHRRRVMPPPRHRYVDSAPEWSPDGDRLVFARRDQMREVSALFTVGIDGASARRITPWTLDGLNRPDWSADGRWILLHKPSRTGQTQLFLVHPDGRGLTKVTHTPHYSWTWSGFSSNGRWITAVRNPGAVGENDVYVMTLHGKRVRNVTRVASSMPTEGLPDWGSRR